MPYPWHQDTAIESFMETNILHPLKSEEVSCALYSGRSSGSGIGTAFVFPGHDPSDIMKAAPPIHSYGLAQDSHLLPFSPYALASDIRHLNTTI